MKANQFEVCREGNRQMDRQANVDKFMEGRNSGEFVKTNEELLLDQEWEARWQW